MRRASIVIPVWNQWPVTRACLEALRSAIGPEDEVLVVDNGSRDETAAELARMPWIAVLTNETNRGFAAACNQGAAAATGAAVVFLNNDTLVPEQWVEGLLAPFADPAVVATGPMSNCASGPQGVDGATYDARSLTAFRAFADEWRRAQRRRTSETRRLVGFCLAVRTDALRAVGGWDEGFGIGGAEDDDLCLRLAAAGGRLLICHDTFVHHHGHATFDGNALDRLAIEQANVQRLVAKHRVPPPRREARRPLLSACMIVKDEATLLAGCLASLDGLADEIVVYDTGSSDGSQATARASGARVVQGYWDDDFGRARTAALAHCTGEWVLQIDADEVFTGDAAAVRAALERTDVDALLLEIRNLAGDDRGDVSHQGCRLFRRERFHWQGRLHEQVVPRSGPSAFPIGLVDGVCLIHSGYTPERMQAKRKAERNLHLATLEARDGRRRDPLDTLLNLARSHMLADRHDDALALFAAARALPCDAPNVQRTLSRCAAQVCLASGRPAAALPWIADLERVSGTPAMVRYLRGSAQAALGRWREALAALDGLEEPRDEDGNTLPRHLIDVHRARCHFMLAEWTAAADAAMRVVRATVDEPIWDVLAESCQRAGRDLRPALEAVPEARLPAVFAQLLRLPPATAHALLDGLVDDPRYRPQALALAIRIAPAMAREQAEQWSARLHALGLGEHCPLRPVPALPAAHLR